MGFFPVLDPRSDLIHLTPTSNSRPRRQTPIPGRVVQLPNDCVHTLTLQAVYEQNLIRRRSNLPDFSTPFSYPDVPLTIDQGQGGGLVGTLQSLIEVKGDANRWRSHFNSLNLR